MDKKLEVFRNEHCLNKEELQRATEQLIEHYATCDRYKFGFSDAYRQCVLALCNRFKNTLNDYPIPPLTENWWFYEIEILNDSIDLTVLSCSDYELDENGNEQSMTLHEGFALISVKSDYLTVEQFAQVYGVTITTVDQWIRKGKLRTAKKVGNDWLVPAIADKPSRRFESADYSWEQLPVETQEQFPFLKDCNRINIFQDQSNKSQFICITGSRGKNISHTKIILTVKEVEKLEFELISAGSVKVEPMRVTFKPYKR